VQREMLDSDFHQNNFWSSCSYIKQNASPL
jgi:hypothetical protein